MGGTLSLYDIADGLLKTRGQVLKYLRERPACNCYIQKNLFKVNCKVCVVWIQLSNLNGITAAMEECASFREGFGKDGHHLCLKLKKFPLKSEPSAWGNLERTVPLTSGMAGSMKLIGSCLTLFS